MYIKTLVSAAALVSGLATASAADLGGSVKDTPVVQVISPAWTGLYISGSVGADFRQPTVSAEGASADLGVSGATFGVRVGYDRELSNGLIAGVYVEGERLADVNGHVAELKLSDTWAYGAGVRGGFKVGNAFPYAIVGYVHKDGSIGGEGLGQDGIAAGGGIEFSISRHWSFALEGRGQWFNSEKFEDFNDAKLDLTGEQVTVRLAYRPF